MFTVKDNKKLAKLFVLLALASYESLLVRPVAGVQGPILLKMGDTDVCSSLCLKRGKTFCGRSNFTAGICCSDIDGCPEEDKMQNDALICSDTISDPLLKHFTCPAVSGCGQKIVKAYLD